MSEPRTLSSSGVFAGALLPLRVMRIPAHGSGPVQHRHEFSELVVILGGSGKHRVGGEVYRIETGDVFVILGDTSHGYPEAEDLYLVNILYDPVRLGLPLADIGGLAGYHALFELEPKLRRNQRFRNRLRLSADQLAHVTQLIAELEEELNGERHGRYYLATAHLMRLIGYLSRAYAQIEEDEVRPVTQISKLLGHLERHCREPLRIGDLTRIAGMSQTSLMRHFGQVMGHSPIEHLIQLRIGAAKKLLRQTDLPITSIALEVGFCDGNYLARQFRRVVGVSPREYRQERGGSRRG